LIHNNKINNKKAVLFTLWAELFAIALLVVGFIFSFTTIGSSFVSYIVVFLWGMMFGRLWYKLRKSFRFPWLLIIIGFLVGYVLASMIHDYGKPFLLVLFYFIGMVISYQLHATKRINPTEH